MQAAIVGSAGGAGPRVGGLPSAIYTSLDNLPVLQLPPHGPHGALHRALSQPGSEPQGGEGARGLTKEGLGQGAVWGGEGLQEAVSMGVEGATATPRGQAVGQLPTVGRQHGGNNMHSASERKRRASTLEQVRLGCLIFTYGRDTILKLESLR